MKQVIGMMACFNTSQALPAMESESKLSLYIPNSGSQPSLEKNKSCKYSAATNAGSEYSMYSSVLTVRSRRVPARTVAHKPSGIERR